MFLINRNTEQKMIQFDKNYADDSILLFIINPKSDWSRGPDLFCFNLLVICFQKRNSPCKQEFPEVKIRRQVLDHYLASKSNKASHYDILIIENVPPRTKVNQLTTTSNKNRWYRIRFLKNFYGIFEQYPTTKLTKSRLNLHKWFFLHHLLLYYIIRTNWNLLWVSTTNILTLNRKKRI